MHLLRRCFVAFLLLFAAPVQAAGDSAWFYRGSDLPQDPAWRFGTLANGVRYAVRRNALPAGQVSIRVQIDAGSLNEADHERGWAHFVEHLLFRGTKSFGDREARYIWQQLGASFGSDTNAYTDPSDTVYQLDLPHADRASLGKSLKILAEMVDVALFAPPAVEAERKIVLAEKGRRPEIAVRIDEVSRPLFYAGLKYAERDPIGTGATLAAATPDDLRAFYERWYRPENATVIAVGDADPTMLEELIAAHFSAWQGTGPAPPKPDYGSIRKIKDRAATVAYPGAPYSASVMWLRPHDDRPDTIARSREELAETLAQQILNRRLEAKARGDAAFLNAGVGVGRSRRIVDQTQLSLTSKNGLWREALAESFAIVADALRARPSKSEIAREMANLRRSLATAVAAESTVRSNQRAGQLVYALDSGEVLVSAAAGLELFDRLAPGMTPSAVEAALRRVFSGAGPRLLLVTPQPVSGGNRTATAALAAAEKARPAVRAADRAVSFDQLPPLGSPGKEVSRQQIEDMGVTIIRFSNGSTLTFKQSDFEKGSVLVRLGLGSGLAGLPAEKQNGLWMSGMVAPSGLADLDLDAMERLMTGRRMNISFSYDEDAYSLSGSTNAEDLGDQLRLLATKLAYPRWDSVLFNRYKSSFLESYDLAFASAATRGGREFGAVSHPGDERWTPIEKDRIAAASPDDLKAFFTAPLAARPIDAIIVGDVDLPTALKAMEASVAALPSSSPPAGQRATGVVSPRPDPKPRVFTHKGDKDQAYAVIGWSTFGGTGKIVDRRALALATSILRVRLFDRLREDEGATYSPSASSSYSEIFPAWGIFTASAELRPESVDTFFRIAREEVAKLAAKPADAAEFARAQNPAVSGIERRLKTNAYWFSALENWTDMPELIEQTRNHLSDYRNLTAERVRAAVAAYVADEGDWSMLVLPEKRTEKAESHGN